MEPVPSGDCGPSAAPLVKRVIVVPIIHNAADLGSLAESVRAHYVERLGPAGWPQRERAVRNLWRGIARALDALPLDYRRVRIYQDGLPICGKEEAIVQELAQAGSLNHQLVRELTGRGAVLMGTEDPQLLLREYQLHRRRAGAAAAQDEASRSGEAAGILADRDRFIAARIAATLQEGETGLLFLGAAHQLDALRAAGLEATMLGGA
jgi:hypothetical protein